MLRAQGFLEPGNVQEDLFHHLTLGMEEVNRRWGDPLREHLPFLPARGWGDWGLAKRRAVPCHA